MTDDANPHALIAAASSALAKAGKAAGIAAAAAAIGLAALVVGMLAAGLAALAMMARVTGEMLSLLATLITGMIDAVVAMVPELLRACISLVAIVSMWTAFNWAWAGYSQDMPSWVAAIMAATIAVVPVAYGFYRHLWPWVLAMSMVVVGASWLLMQAGALVRTLAIVGALGAIVWRDVMQGRYSSQEESESITS